MPGWASCCPDRSRPGAPSLPLRLAGGGLTVTEHRRCVPGGRHHRGDQGRLGISEPRAGRGHGDRPEHLPVAAEVRRSHARRADLEVLLVQGPALKPRAFDEDEVLALALLVNISSGRDGFGITGPARSGIAKLMSGLPEEARRRVSP